MMLTKTPKTPVNFCPDCGAAVGRDQGVSRFCHNCGGPLPLAPRPAALARDQAFPSTTQSRLGWIAFLAGYLVAIGVSAIATLLYAPDHGASATALRLTLIASCAALVASPLPMTRSQNQTLADLGAGISALLAIIASIAAVVAASTLIYLPIEGWSLFFLAISLASVVGFALISQEIYPGTDHTTRSRLAVSAFIVIGMAFASWIVSCYVSITAPTGPGLTSWYGGALLMACLIAGILLIAGRTASGWTALVIAGPLTIAAVANAANGSAGPAFVCATCLFVIATVLAILATPQVSEAFGVPTRRVPPAAGDPDLTSGSNTEASRRAGSSHPHGKRWIGVALAAGITLGLCVAWVERSGVFIEMPRAATSAVESEVSNAIPTQLASEVRDGLYYFSAGDRRDFEIFAVKISGDQLTAENAVGPSGNDFGRCFSGMRSGEVANGIYVGNIGEYGSFEIDVRDGQPFLTGSFAHLLPSTAAHVNSLTDSAAFQPLDVNRCAEIVRTAEADGLMPD